MFAQAGVGVLVVAVLVRPEDLDRGDLVPVGRRADVVEDRLDDRQVGAEAVARFGPDQGGIATGEGDGQVRVEGERELDDRHHEEDEEREDEGELDQRLAARAAASGAAGGEASGDRGGRAMDRAMTDAAPPSGRGSVTSYLLGLGGRTFAMEFTSHGWAGQEYRSPTLRGTLQPTLVARRRTAPRSSRERKETGAPPGCARPGLGDRTWVESRGHRPERRPPPWSRRWISPCPP